MKKAFTLIELLVVIGILGVLAGIMLSTFGGAGESARATKCLANMRNLAMAVQSYAMGNGGGYPGSGNWISVRSKDKDSSYISPYDSDANAREFSLTNGAIWVAANRSRDIYFCPHHQRYARDHKLGNDPLWSYVMNGKFSGSYGSVERADRTLLFAELPFAKVTNGSFTQTGELSDDELDPVLDAPTLNATGKGGEEVIGFNHKLGKDLYGHVCFADGHVEKLVAPRAGDVKELTAWLCIPTETTDSVERDIDFVFNGERYIRSDQESN